MIRFFYIIILFSTMLNLSSAANPNEVTLPLNFSQGLPSTFIYIDDKKIPLLVDTGASKYSIVLSKYALKNLKVIYTGTQSCSKTVDGKVCMKEFIIPTVKIGNIVLHNVAGSELQRLWGGDKGFIETDASRNGLIGLAFLKKFNFLIDYKNNKIIISTLTSFQNFNTRNCSKVKFALDKGILAEFMIDNKKEKLIIDTGSNLSYIKSKKLNQRLLSCDNHYAKEIDNCHQATLKLFSEDGYVGSENFYVSNMYLPFDGILGETFIKKYSLIINSYNKKLYLCKA
jgi:predicted aspartyl protease